jgi:hypothetical protein
MIKIMIRMTTRVPKPIYMVGSLHVDDGGFFYLDLFWQFFCLDGEGG